MTLLIEQLQSAINLIEKNAYIAPYDNDKQIMMKESQYSKEVPRFFFQKDFEDPLTHLLQKLAIESRLERVEVFLLTSSDLQLIWTSLESNSRIMKLVDGKVINYEEFKKIAMELPDKVRWLFKPDVFMCLPKSDTGCISIQMLYNYISRASKISLILLFISLFFSYSCGGAIYAYKLLERI